MRSIIVHVSMRNYVYVPEEIIEQINSSNMSQDEESPVSGTEGLT